MSSAAMKPVRPYATRPILDWPGIWDAGGLDRIVRPEILPGEIAHGYLNRVLRRNGLANSFRLFEIFGVNHWKTSLRHGDLVSLLARIAGIPTCEFIDKHSLATLVRCVQPTRARAAQDELLSHGVWLPGGELRYCPACALRDEHDFTVEGGTQYAHRLHQLPGVYHCKEHLVSLTRMRADLQIGAKPSRHQSRWAQFTYDPQCWPGTAAVNRYANACEFLINRYRPVTTTACILVMRGLMREKGILGVAGRPGDGPTLDARLESQFGSAWVELIRPVRRANAKPSQPVLRTGVNAAVLFAGLTDSVASCIAALHAVEAMDIKIARPDFDHRRGARRQAAKRCIEEARDRSPSNVGGVSVCVSDASR